MQERQQITSQLWSPSQPVGEVEEVIDVGGWVMLQQLDIGGEVSS